MRTAGTIWAFLRQAAVATRHLTPSAREVRIAGGQARDPCRGHGGRGSGLAGPTTGVPGPPR